MIGFFALESLNPDLLGPIWGLTTMNYNERVPAHAQKTQQQLQKALNSSLTAIRTKYGLDAKKDKDEVTKYWKKKISDLVERQHAEKKIEGLLTKCAVS